MTTESPSFVTVARANIKPMPNLTFSTTKPKKAKIGDESLQFETIIKKSKEVKEVKEGPTKRPLKEVFGCNKSFFE